MANIAIPLCLSVACILLGAQQPKPLGWVAILFSVAGALLTLSLWPR